MPGVSTSFMFGREGIGFAVGFKSESQTIILLEMEE